MTYTPEQVDHLHLEVQKTLRGLQELQLKIVAEGQPLDATSRLREHLLHGVGRRLGVIRKTIANIYSLFPTESDRPLDPETIDDIQINLHAFVMNLYGVFDNWAWAFVLHHNLEVTIIDRRRIGLFNSATQCHLPAPLRSYLASPTMTKWHEQYAKSFRDALAHRIPPYLPPAQFTDEEGVRYSELENEKVECIKRRQWNRLDEIYDEQAGIGTPCFMFMHAFSEDTPPIRTLLHPQLLSDGNTVIEFGELFLAHWHQTA